MKPPRAVLIVPAAVALLLGGVALGRLGGEPSDAAPSSVAVATSSVTSPPPSPAEDFCDHAGALTDALAPYLDGRATHAETAAALAPLPDAFRTDAMTYRSDRDRWRRIRNFADWVERLRVELAEGGSGEGTIFVLEFDLKSFVKELC